MAVRYFRTTKILTKVMGTLAVYTEYTNVISIRHLARMRNNHTRLLQSLISNYLIILFTHPLWVVLAIHAHHLQYTYTHAKRSSIPTQTKT